MDPQAPLPPTADIQRPTKAALNAATEAAKAFVHKIKSAYYGGNISSYRVLETKYGFPLGAFADERKDEPILGAFLEHLLRLYIQGTEARLIAALNTKKEKKKLRLAADEDCYRFTNQEKAIADSAALGETPILRLFREQDPAMRECFDLLYKQNYRTVMNNGGCGSGKTPFACALVDKIIAEQKHECFLPLSFPIIWFTVGNAVQQTRESLIRCGLGDELNRTIHVFGYPALTSTEGKGRLVEYIKYEDAHNEGQINTMINWMQTALAKFVIFDEFHRLARDQSNWHKCMVAFDRALRAHESLLDTKFLFMSGTPIERINDSKLFVCMSDIKYQNTVITYDNFKQNFADILANGEPHLPNKAAAGRFFSALGDRIVEFPYIKWPHKAINSVRFYDFQTAEDRIFYDSSVDRYLDRISKLGKETPGERAMRYIALMQLRKEVEPIRSKQVANDMHADVQAGYSPCMGTAFTGSIIKSVFHLMDTYGYTRDDISIIWGGRANIKPDSILTESDLVQIMTDALASGEGLDAKTQRLIKRTLAWQEDRLLFGDVSDEAQDARYARLRSLGLIGIQTMAKRQAEIKKFKHGISKICFFTSASGGTGLSLEHGDDRTYPRRMYATPIYSGKEFTQLFSRCPRRNSISDTYQFICLMRNTVEQKHVAPILDLKLQCLGEITSQKTDIAEILSQLTADEFVSGNTTYQQIRTLEQAELQADDDRTQLHETDNDEDEDDEDENNDN